MLDHASPMGLKMVVPSLFFLILSVREILLLILWGKTILQFSINIDSLDLRPLLGMELRFSLNYLEIIFLFNIMLSRAFPYLILRISSNGGIICKFLLPLLKMFSLSIFLMWIGSMKFVLKASL